MQMEVCFEILISVAFSYISFIPAHKACESGHAHENVFEKEESDKRARYSECDIYNVVVRGIYRGEPDAEGDDAEKGAHPPGGA